jgi:hypothetical protein
MRPSRLPAALTVGMLLLGAVMLVAQSSAPGLGTWNLDVSRSKYSPGPAPKSQTVRYEMAGNGVKRTIDTVSAKGETTHSEITFVDGKEVPVPNAPQPTTLTWKRIDDHTTEVVQRVNGKVTVTTRRVIANDGRTATITQTGTNAQGQKVNNTMIQTKQQ